MMIGTIPKSPSMSLSPKQPRQPRIQARFDDPWILRAWEGGVWRRNDIVELLPSSQSAFFGMSSIET